MLRPISRALPSRRLVRIVIASVTLAGGIIIGSGNPASATTCTGHGDAEATFLPGSITASETRLANTTWNFDCSTKVLSSASTQSSAYSNIGVDLTTQTIDYNPAWEQISTYIDKVNNRDRFAAVNSYVGGTYGYTLYTSVRFRTDDSDPYDFQRSCDVESPQGNMPGYTLHCSAAD